MPKKVKAAPTEDVNVATPVPEVEQPTQTVKKTKKTKSKKETVEIKTEPVVESLEPEPTQVGEELEPPSDVITDCAENGVCPVPTKKGKRVITKADIIADLEGVFGDVISEVKDKSLVKRVKQLKSDLVRLFKLRNVNKKDSDNPNSGFRKPVDVSPEMRNFLKLSPSELTRRLDITKRLCDYIKENNLQDVKDRRNIIPDETLRKLLSIDVSDPPLTYYSIQQKLKPHIIKV
jgi:chromatin remodeling complex protein RSC6